VQLGRAGGDRRVKRRGNRQIAVLDLDQIACVFRACRRLGDHHGNGFPDETHAALRKHRMQGFQHCLAALARKIDDVGQ
jgi:hypothetical protein